MSSVFNVQQLKANNIRRGFTLIELMIVMSIVALLMGLVGPLAINSVEKAQAKQEMLTLKNWLRKISDKAFYSGKSHRIELKGKQVLLFMKGEENSIAQTSFDSLFFQPQEIHYNPNGFADLKILKGTHRNNLIELNLSTWLNNEIHFDQLNETSRIEVNN